MRPLIFMGTLVAGFIGFSSPTSAGALLVTMTSDNVQIQDASGTRASPRGGFPLLDGQTLIIPEGGKAVVLSQGSAVQVVGPRNFTTGDSVGTTSQVSAGGALSSVMGRQSSNYAVGATRGGAGFQLLLPVEGSHLMDLKEIRWECSGCEEQSIELIHLESFESVWWGKGVGTLSYVGEKLSPGEYSLKVGDQYLAFHIASAEEADLVRLAVEQAKASSEGLADEEKLAIEAAILAHAGMLTETLYLLHTAKEAEPSNGRIQELLESYRAMVRPE